MVLCVIRQVAPLAPGHQVFLVAMTGVMIEVGHGQYHPHSGDWMRLSVPSAAVGIGRTAFATIPGAVPNGAAYRFPVLRVQLPIDRHHFPRHTLIRRTCWRV